MNSVRLLLKASFQGQALVRQLVEDVTGGDAAVPGMLSLYGVGHDSSKDSSTNGLPSVGKERGERVGGEMKTTETGKGEGVTGVTGGDGGAGTGLFEADAGACRGLTGLDDFLDKWSRNKHRSPDTLMMSASERIDFVVDMFAVLR